MIAAVKLPVAVIAAIALVSCAKADDEDLSKHPNLSLLPGQDECGKFIHSPDFQGSLHDTDGKMHNASLGAFPSVALLGYPERGKINYKCLGALISKRHVLTTYDCIERGAGGLPVVVRLGYVNASDETNCYHDKCHPPQDIDVKNVIIHEERRLQYRNDIVMLQLESDVTFNDFVQPACLPLNQEYSRNLNEVTIFALTWRVSRTSPPYPLRSAAAGEAAAEPSPDACQSRKCRRTRDTGLLQYAADIIVEDLECRNTLAYGAQCDDCIYSLRSTICVEADETKDFCERKAGSPVLYTVPSPEEITRTKGDAGVPKFYLAGLQQWTVSCYSTTVSTATSTTSLLKWILDHLSYCNKAQ